MVSAVLPRAAVDLASREGLLVEIGVALRGESLVEALEATLRIPTAGDADRLLLRSQNTLSQS